MNESDPTSAGARTGSFVHELVTQAATLVEGAFQIGNSEADVVDSRATFPEKLGNRSIRCHRLHQLDLHVAEVQGNNNRTVGC
ncbi:MAG: hypothetical protein AMS21_13000 [Gemmatimonas sp. SG8_38_2]|nr:MAG: hypothetical protein AMS21_13000 [Gemmatimonas sp. SG8_38_2]